MGGFGSGRVAISEKTGSEQGARQALKETWPAITVHSARPKCGASRPERSSALPPLEGTFLSLTVAVRALALSVVVGTAQHFAPTQVGAVATWLSEPGLGSALTLMLCAEYLRRADRKNDPQA